MKPARPVPPLFAALLALAFACAAPAPAPAAAPAPPPVVAPGEKRIALPGDAGEFLLVPNPAAENAWFYLPLSLRPLERAGPQGDEPDLELVKFQRVDPKNPEALEEGALLTVALALARPAKTLASLADRVAREAKAPSASLSLLPIRGATLEVTSASGRAPLLAPPLAGVGPLRAFDALRFSLTFGKLDARCAEELVTAASGIKLSLLLDAPAPPPPGADRDTPRPPNPLRIEGTLSLADLPAAIRERLVHDEARAFFERARLILPAIAEDPDLGIERIQFDVVPVLPAGRAMPHQADPLTFTWTPAAGRWVDAKGEPALTAVFDLAAIKADLGEAKMPELRFKVTRSFECAWRDPKGQVKKGRFKEYEEQPVFDGEAPVATPLVAADVLVVDPGSLSWKGVPGGDGSPLEGVYVNVKAGNFTVERLLAPAEGADRKLAPPGPCYVLVPRQRRKPVSLAAEFRLAGGARVAWVDPFPGDLDQFLYVAFYDSDLAPPVPKR